MGIGFAKGIAAVDLKVLKKIFISWILTVPLSAATAAIIFMILTKLG